MPHPKIKISDDTGNTVGVTSNRLDVNAYLSATPTIDIGDVSLLLGGTAASVNNGAADATTLRVTIASDTTGVLSVDDNGSTLSIDDGGGVITVDGTVDLGSTATTHLSEIEGAVETIESAIGTDGSTGPSNCISIGGTVTIGGNLQELQCSAAGVLAVSDAGGSLTVDGTVTANLGTTDNAVLDAIAASLALLDNSIASGNELQVDVVAALPAGTNAIGKLSANSGVDIGDVDVTSISAGTNAIGKVGHDITGMVSDRNTAVSDSTAEQLNGATDDSYDQACKRVDLQAATINTGYILVGDYGLASNLSGGGIKLNPGDFYSMDVNNVGDIYVLAEVNAEDIFFTYYT